MDCSFYMQAPEKENLDEVAIDEILDLAAKKEFPRKMFIFDGEKNFLADIFRLFHGGIYFLRFL